MIVLKSGEAITNLSNHVVGRDVFPLYIRYTDDTVEYYNQNASISFDEVKRELSGEHTCFIVHRRRRKKGSEYDELVVQVKGCSYSVVVSPYMDGYTLKNPTFQSNKMALPKDVKYYINCDCNIRFVDISEIGPNLLMGASPYWRSNVEKLKDFISSCMKLPIIKVGYEVETDSKLNEYIDGNSVIPLYVRYTNKNVDYYNQNLTVSFAEAKEALSGEHICYFMHRRRTKNDKEYEELIVKVENCSYSMVISPYKDGYTFVNPIFQAKNIELPENENLYTVRKCNVKFVDINEDVLVTMRKESSVDSVIEFIESCMNLVVPEVEIEVEKERQMWQAYLDGLNALLENKRELIKIQDVSKLEDGYYRFSFNTSSYAENLKNAITETLVGRCEQKFSIYIEDGECLIIFNDYQAISEDILEDIKIVGRDYCYSVETEPVNIVRGRVSIVSAIKGLEKIQEEINKELQDFDLSIRRSENGDFLLSTDADVIFLQKIVETRFSGIVEVKPATKLIMPLYPHEEDVDIEKLKGNLPDVATIEPYGDKYYLVSSQRPLDTTLEIFDNLRFLSCMVKIWPPEIDSQIEMAGATIENNAYRWIINDIAEINSLGKLFKDVCEKYPNQYIKSKYFYAFAPQIDKSILQTLKLNNYEKKSFVVDVPRSCVIFKPTNEMEYISDRDDILSQLKGENIDFEIPDYIPMVRVEYLFEDENYRKEIFEKVMSVLVGNDARFTKKRLTKDVRNLEFEFEFGDLEERDEIEKIIKESLKGVKEVEVRYDNPKGITRLSLTEDSRLLQELERKLQSDFRNEYINYIKGSDYDKLEVVDEEELSRSHASKEKIIKNRKYQYLKNNSRLLGICVRRHRDYAIVELNEDIIDALSINDFNINSGDYVQFPAMGETIELLRQSKAMGRILHPEGIHNGLPINPNLPNFIFDPKYAREIVVDIKEKMEDIRAHKIGQLNEKQLEAVTKSVYAKDLALIQGPPGTGKTTVIAEIIWQTIRKNPNSRILVTSQTNLAVDNALERLQGQSVIRPIRIGNPERLEPEGCRYSIPIIDQWALDVNNNEENATKMWMDRIRSRVSTDSRYGIAVEDWKKELEGKTIRSRMAFSRMYKNNINLVAATCSICGSGEFIKAYSEIFECSENGDMYFDVVIMDEASKATPLEMAVPLVLGKKIIIIGDHKQLPPMMDENTIDSALEKIGKRDLAETLQNSESQFKRLFESASKVRKTIVATLDTQYRMHEQIMNTIKQFYGKELAETGGLKCGILDTMDIPDLSNKGSRWHGISMGSIISPSKHAVWIDVKTPEIFLNPGYKNEGELEAIDMVLEGLHRAKGFNEFMNAQLRPEDKEIGIITFYSAQNREIRRKYKSQNYRMDVVDRFQGMERNIVIVSTVRSNEMNRIGFAKETERINVAFSRARCLLIVVGNKHLFEKNSNYATSIANMDTVDIEQLKDAIK